LLDNKKAIADALGIEEYYLFEPTWKLRTTTQLYHVLAKLRELYPNRVLVDEIVSGMFFVICHDAQDGDGEDAEPLERAGLQYDIDETSELEVRISAYRFLIMADPMDLDAYLSIYDGDQAGIDIWLGLTHAGAGFWDRDIPGGDESIGDRLNTCAQLCSTLSYAWLNTDGKISVE
jgi:hypothetical protein